MPKQITTEAIGPETMKRAMRTDAGQYVIGLGNMLYSAHVEKGESQYHADKLIVPAKIRVGDDHVDTQQWLRGLEDYLIGVAIREVT